MYSSLIPDSQQGTTIDSLMHSTDWVNTLVNGAAGIDHTTGDGYDFWAMIIGDDDTVLRNDIPIGMDYVDNEGALIQHTHGSFFKFMKFDKCEAWYSPTSGNATIKPSAFDITDDDAATAWCDASGDADSEYKLYDLGTVGKGLADGPSSTPLGTILCDARRT